MKIKGMAAAFMMCISMAGCSAANTDVTDVDCSSPAAAQSTYVKDAAELEHWTDGSESAASIREFVEQITDRESGHYVPPQDRIAVFDFDGTLYGEQFPTFFERCMFVHRVLDDPTYDAPADMKAYAQELRTQMNEHRVSSDLEEQYDKYSTMVYEGMTMEEYQQYVRDFLEQPCTGFDDMTYGDGYFLPMVSLVKYLYSNNFKVYICSGSDRNTLRALTEGVLDKYIPPERCIGTDNMVSAPAQNGEDPAKYQYQAEDELVYGKTIAQRNMNTNKVISIQREIGKAPLMVFGNSEGDLSMAQMALQNKYGGQAYLLLCDDTDRDYGDTAKAEELKKTCDERGFHTVSMKDEFAEIYAVDTMNGTVPEPAPEPEPVPAPEPEPSPAPLPDDVSAAAPAYDCGAEIAA